MIDAIIFDFGDVFINLEKDRCAKAFLKLGLSAFTAEIYNQTENYEKGLIDETTFLRTFQKCIPSATLPHIKAAWNMVLGDFPQERLDFVQNLSRKYRLFLLSNTDKTHIQHFEASVGAPFYTAFYNCFEQVFYSYELQLRKPDAAVFIKIITENNLSIKNTLFVDDKKQNTDAAQLLGMPVWNLQVGQEEVTDLAKKSFFNT